MQDKCNFSPTLFTYRETASIVNPTRGWDLSIDVVILWGIRPGFVGPMAISAGPLFSWGEYGAK